MDAAVAFLDLLGFSEYTKTDLLGAARLLESQRTTLTTKLADARTYAAHGTDLSPLARDHLVSSFDHFLPVSDSIFIASATPDQFVRQLATFLIGAFVLTGHTYAQPDDPAHPEEVGVRLIGSAKREREKQHWYPALWRGGISFGQVELLSSEGLVDGKAIRLPLLVGLPVVTAVGLEKNSGKGPRLFCEPGFKRHLTDAGLLPYFVPVPEKSCDEFLWPAFLFHDHEHPIRALSQVHELLVPAINLWRAKRDTAVAAHYFEFIRLIGRSASKWAEYHGVGDEGRGVLRQQLLTFAGNDLVDTVLS